LLRQQGGRLRLTILDLKDKDAAIAAAVRVPLCCEHCPVSPVGIGGGQARPARGSRPDSR